MRGRSFFSGGNPVINAMTNKASALADTSAKPMTLNGTVNKVIILFLLVVLSATFTWKLALPRPELTSTLMIVGAVGGFITALITIFSPARANIFSIIYVLFEGLLLGGLSAFFEQIVPGIVFQAVMLTFAVFGVMLFLYKARILKATPGFIKGVVIATGGIALFYIINLIIGAFGGHTVNLFEMGWTGVIIQLVIVGVAALNLIIDFHTIEEGIAQGAPQKMEWYAAFGLMVTLIWLYIEILRLLLILAANRD